MNSPEIPQGLTFDDVLISPSSSSVLPGDVDISTRLVRDIELNTPVISAAMDTVTEANLAIAMAQAGGLGILHRNQTNAEQAEQVVKVKKFESVMVTDPVTISPGVSMHEAIQLMRNNGISGVPVIEPETKVLKGILTNRDARFLSDESLTVERCMTPRSDLLTANKDVSIDEAKLLLHKRRVEKLLIVDEADHCIGIITVKDIEKAKLNPNSCKDTDGRLRVGAAIGVGAKHIARAEELIEANVDVLVIDTAHGQQQQVLDTVKTLSSRYPDTPLIAGNIATAEGAKALIEAGADCVKVGIGPGSICTTRIIAGVGVPQLTAIFNVSAECKKHGIPMIADGGIKYSGDIVKAIAAGADCVMIGSMLAGTDEAPGELILYQGRTFKAYRGMGSVGAMARGSADRYFQKEVQGSSGASKLVPEGVEGQVPYKGATVGVIHQLSGGLRAGMGYTGSSNLSELRQNAKFIQISAAGFRESHAHDVRVVREAPNYASSN